jgi:ADP-heptose:LPS heptosyltransferase
MRILFIGPTRIGDAVLCSGVLHWMIRRWPGARVTVACGPAAAGLYEAVPGLERIVIMAKRPGGGHWRDLWLAAAGKWWTAIADTRRSVVGWLVPAARRYVIGVERHDRHKVLQVSAMVPGVAALAPHLWIAEAARAEAERRIPPGAPVLALAPTANWAGKTWPAERFAQLIERLTAAGGALPGARVALFAGPGEREAALPALAGIAEARRIDLAGTLTLGLAAACLSRAQFFVGNDSGLMHVAAAAGVPTLGLFGPSRDAVYGPWGAHAAAVRTDLSYDEILAQPGYDYRLPVSHMGTLSVDKACAAAEELWRTAPRARPA